MRVAALYDIHGNLPALEAVLDELRSAAVDEVVVGGDVFPGPMSVEAFELLRSLTVPIRFIHGNGDRAILELAETDRTAALPEAYQAIGRWLARQLDPEQRRVMAAWPGSMRLNVENIGAILFCHATPQNDTDVFTSLTPVERLLPIFRNVNAQLVVCGHTHMQFDRMVGNVRVINAGSVGMPFGAPGAYWLVIGPEIEFRRTEYDLESAARRVRATSYPMAAEFAAQNILQPPSESTMLDAFTRASV
jgi:putative phosphoesterase